MCLTHPRKRRKGNDGLKVTEVNVVINDSVGTSSTEGVTERALIHSEPLIVHPKPYPKTVLFDLPADVLHSIFNTGGTLIRAENTCERWRTAIIGNGELWYFAVKRYGIPSDKSFVTNLNKYEGGTAQYTKAAILLADECRKEYKRMRRGICSHCLDHFPWNLRMHCFLHVRICPICMKIEEYGIMSDILACYYFELSSKEVQKVLKHGELDCHSLKPRGKGAKEIKIYKVSQLVDLAKRAFEGKKLLQILQTVRKEFGIVKAKNSQLHDV